MASTAAATWHPTHWLICAQADGTPQLYDFQYCGKACPAKDVAYCLCCGSSAWDEADALARGYHRDLSAALAARGEEPPPVDAFLESLELAYADLGRWMSGWGVSLVSIRRSR